MELNERIVNAAWHLLQRQFLPANKGYCLMTVRLVLERAMKLPSLGFYGVYLKGHAKAAPTVERAWWARDAEKILRNDHGFSVPYDDRQGGDIIFNHTLAPSPEFPGHNIGHTAILLDRNVVLENTGSNRGVVVYGAMRIVPLEQFPGVTTVIRMREL
jgi:hypothetical protein